MVNVQTLRTRFPYGLAAPCVLLMVIAAINLSSAARSGQPHLHWIHLGRFVAACFVTGSVVFVPPSLLRRLAVVAYVLGIGLLLAVLVVGVTVKGSQRWVHVGFTRLQPSELAKLTTLLVVVGTCASDPTRGGYTLQRLFLPFALSRPLACGGAAVFFVAYKGLLWPFSVWKALAGLGGLLVLTTWGVECGRRLVIRGWRWHEQVALADLVGLPATLVFVQPDLGTTVLLAAPAASVVLFRGVRLRSICLAALLVLVGGFTAWHTLLQDYQKKRVEALLHPTSDLTGSGYHGAQSLIAVGSGRWWGKGLGEGTQTQLAFLPENQTDFVLALWAEEWGFVGTTVVLALFFWLILAMLRISQQARNRFGRLLAFGAGALVFWHVAVNVGMVLGLLPVVGVALPFLSYGGTSLLLHTAAAALCVHVAVWRKV
ncbi:MAG: FtsW/RodA/SpoVE family cell cycle protein [Myxococcota bacterium]